MTLQSDPHFDGKTYEADRDHDRLTSQLERVKQVVVGAPWMTLEEIAAITGTPEASVSARLRDLRKVKFGAYTVERRFVHRGLFAYRVLQPVMPEDDRPPLVLQP